MASVAQARKLPLIWLCVPVVGWGPFAWAQFVYFGLRARARVWLFVGGAYLIAACVLLPTNFDRTSVVAAP